jgi:hypothetical protein
MRGDVVKDWVSGQEFVVVWSGEHGASLLNYDTNSTRQRPGAKDYLTAGATMTLDLRARGSIYKGSIQGE